MLASDLGRLSEEIKLKTVDPESKYNFGWSCGKEIMNGKPDTAKGSFYANPLYDVPETDEKMIAKYPFFLRPNKWLPEDLPDLAPAFKSLGELFCQVGGLVARQCDLYAKVNQINGYPEGYLERIIKNSRTTKARLLHYFPKNRVSSSPKKKGNSKSIQTEEEELDDLCGWHLDNSCLTGLASALYIDETKYPTLTPFPSSPDPLAGLYIRNRSGELVQVKIPSDWMAFQIGEALELSTNRMLRATPHCVRGIEKVKVEGGEQVARNTFAVFMQPNIDEPVKPGYTFAEFCEDVFKRHYQS
ncbi:hypothetical protein BKA69DRAFT_1056745 [Paraphysoderma sedebokerense]|nr:hypothetical protein BKA69DRAFT_1056745 [Paraphysoderma sedebokerense]